MTNRGEQREALPEYNLTGADLKRDSKNVNFEIIILAAFSVGMIILMKTDWIETYVIDPLTIDVIQEK
jgi:hypothetical protein